MTKHNSQQSWSVTTLTSNVNCNISHKYYCWHAHPRRLEASAHREPMTSLRLDTLAASLTGLVIRLRDCLILDSNEACTQLEGQTSLN